MDDVDSLVKAARDAFRGRDWVSSTGRLPGRPRRWARWQRTTTTSSPRQHGGWATSTSRWPTTSRPTRDTFRQTDRRAPRWRPCSWPLTPPSAGITRSARAGWPRSPTAQRSARERRARLSDLLRPLRRPGPRRPGWRRRQWRAGCSELGRRFGDANLVALGVLGEGRALLKQGRIDDGMGLLDEAMTAAFSDRAASDLDRGDLLPHDGRLPGAGRSSPGRRVDPGDRERGANGYPKPWCSGASVGSTGRRCCRPKGSWDEAEREATRASAELLTASSPGRSPKGHYQVGEVCRLRGDLVRAEDGVPARSPAGPGPAARPGLVATGRGPSDRRRRRRCGRRSPRRPRIGSGGLGCAPRRSRLRLPRRTWKAAHAASDELTATATAYASPGLTAASLQASRRGPARRRAGHRGTTRYCAAPVRRWNELEAPYDAARTRLLLAAAYRALGDEDAVGPGARRGRHGVRATRGDAGSPHGGDASAVGRHCPAVCSEREAQVLRLVAAGNSNREIAAVLGTE